MREGSCGYRVRVPNERYARSPGAVRVPGSSVRRGTRLARVMHTLGTHARYTPNFGLFPASGFDSLRPLAASIRADKQHVSPGQDQRDLRRLRSWALRIAPVRWPSRDPEDYMGRHWGDGNPDSPPLFFGLLVILGCIAVATVLATITHLDSLGLLAAAGGISPGAVQGAWWLHRKRLERRGSNQTT
jgi:hypothetical protein